MNMTKLINSWIERKVEIQRRYFRCGLYTHFYIAPIQWLSRRTAQISWVYVFGDLGMSNIIKKKFYVEHQSNNSYKVWSVLQPKSRARIVIGEKELLGVVFNHYYCYLDKLYKSMGWHVTLRAIQRNQTRP